MIRDLLTPEAQEDAYVWASVMLAHGCIGAMGWAVMGWAALLVYAGFEVLQAAVSRRWMLWDMVLDFCAVALGAVLIAQQSAWAAVALLVVAAAGTWRRTEIKT